MIALVNELRYTSIIQCTYAPTYVFSLCMGMYIRNCEYDMFAILLVYNVGLVCFVYR